MSFQFRALEIPDVILIEPQRHGDDRGFFLETYKMSSFSANGIPQGFIQDNLSHSVRGVLRGLHYQKHPQAQAKLVMPLRGRIFDVAVDIRQGSAFYGQWVGLELSAECFQMLYVPVGFAHGFCALSEEADVLYKVTAEYAPELDRGIAWNDPQIGVQWPVVEPLLSPKDAGLPNLAQADNNFEMA
jgi:dTDP-4-dehydrorhamnose 3,5-epimerase